ncbi:MAG: formyltransferase family protein [Bacteroidota bacterium]|jgi:methionyl-tRNA formyltransferase
MSNTKSTLHIFGGGELVSVAEKVALENGWEVVIRTGTRFRASMPKLNNSTTIFFGNNLKELMLEGPNPTSNDIGLSISAPWIIKGDVINKFNGRLFNIHNQPLPVFKGAGGSSWRILMNDFSGGACIHFLTEGIDEGKIVSRVDFKFPEECTYPEDFDKVTLGHSKILLHTWLTQVMLKNKIEQLSEYDESLSEYWPRLNSMIHGWINWDWKLSDIKSFCEAFSYPHQGAVTTLREKQIFIRSANFIIQKGKFHPFQTGLIYNIIESKIFVAHYEGTLIIEDYDLGSENLNIRLGDRLFSPKECLENAFKSRIQYLPDGTVVKI